MGRSSSSLNTSEVNRILKLVADKGWTARLNGKSTYLLIPPEGDPMPLRQSSTGKFLTFAQLRSRGIEADPRRVNRPARTRNSDRPYTAPVTEWDKYALPTMATDRRAGKPLPVGYQPSNWAKSFRFSSHAKTRIRERNAHEWECYAALDLQDFAYEPKRDGQAVRCHVRGDLIVVVDAQRRRIITVVDTNSCVYPSVPRVMYAPVPTENPVTQPTENVEPAPVEMRPWQNTTHPLSFRTRLYMADQGTDRDVPAQEVIEALDAVPGRVYSILSRLTESGLILRVEEGRYRPIDIDGLGQMPDRGYAAQLGLARKAKEQNGIEARSLRSRLLDVLRTLEIGELHTVPELRAMIGEEYGSTSNLYGLCRDLAVRGIMTEVIGGGNITEYALRIRPIPLDEYVNTHRRILQDELLLATGLSSMGLGKALEAIGTIRRIGPKQWVNDAVPVHSGPEQVVEPEPERVVQPEPKAEPIVVTEPEPERVVEPEPEPIEPEPPVVEEPPVVVPVDSSVFGKVDIDVDSAVAPKPLPRLNNYDGDEREIPAPRRPVTIVQLPDPGVDLLDPDPVAVGFEFMALPTSAIYPIAAAIAKNIAALHEHRGQWARIASYAGTDDNAEELARKQAAEVAAYLGDATLQFAVRWETELHIGVFVRVRPA